MKYGLVGAVGLPNDFIYDARLYSLDDSEVF